MKGRKKEEGVIKRTLLQKGHSTTIFSYIQRRFETDAILSRKALDRRLHVDLARDPREGPRVLMSLRVDFEPMG